ncbi:MAG TPA: tetratricopeptide repeat-containing protein kinase family protein, partial [Luteimonas sp.]|nr:tetratricopeptide repeat-containing protein kinase family protein [Luteimonas sp.]
FGIGQFADTQEERTQTMWRALTPGYAAPEQLAGAPPSTAVDVYGLGALLHRLLTGRTPQAATQSTDTTRPSLLVRDAGDAYHRHYVPLKNDLDRVLLKALAEEPEQRYATTEALADDLRRWLDGQPVLAQKPKLGYRMRKFAMRNKVGVAAGVLLAMSLAGGVAATLWQAAEARRAAEQALTQEQRATAARDFMVQLFEANDPNAAMHGPLTARDLLDQGAHRINGAFANTPVLRAEMLVLLGDLYRRIDELGAATPLLTEGLQLAEETGDPTIRLEARLGKGLLDVQANRPEDALAEFDAAERMFEDAGRIPEDLHGQLVMHRTHTLSGMGKTQEAVSYAEDALARARASTTLPPESLFFYLRALSSALVVGGQEQRAEELLDEAITLRSVDKLPPTARLPVHSYLASFALARGELETALHRASEALELAEQVYLPTHRERSAVLDQQGIILTHMARFDEAVAAISDSISILEALDPKGYKADLSAAYNNLALALDNAERDAEAEPHMIRALELTGQAFGTDDPRYAIAVANLGNLYRQSGRYEEADTLLGEGLRMRRELLGDEHPYFAHGLVQVARLRLRQGRPAEALELAEQAADIYAKAEHKDPRRLASTDGVRAVAMAAVGRVEEAVTLYDKAIADAREAGIDNGVEWPRVMAARAELFAQYLPERAREVTDEAVSAHLAIYGEGHPGTKQMLTLAASLR